MKHNYKQAVKAKNTLILHYNYYKCDFADDGETVTCLSKDDAGESAFDIWKNLEMERREEVGLFPSSNFFKTLKYVDK